MKILVQFKPCSAMARRAALAAIFLTTSLLQPTRAAAPATTQSTTQPINEGGNPSVTAHTITLNNQPLTYTATAGTIALKNDKQEKTATMFFIAYEKSPAADSDRGSRPITFVFNGGPGAAAIWLHLGCVGPKRVVLPADGAPPSPPYQLTDNVDSWLDTTDLVFIDPVGTGYSRAEPDKERQFYGVSGDLDSVSDFIRIYLTKYQRWLSPKFLAGESYGTTRAAGLSEALHDRYGIDLNGIVLISTILNFATLNPGDGNELPFPLYLPSYAAVAHFHHKLPADLQGDLKQTIAAAQNWALGDYSAALLRGTSLGDADREKIAQQLARFTGLPIDYVRRSNLRIRPERFEKQLLADQQQIIGRMDGRFSAHDADPTGDSPEFDPTLNGYVGLFSNTFNDYIRRDLKYENELTYEFLSPNVGPWDFGGGGGFLNVATTLRRAMTKLPNLKVMIASGQYDLATPFTAAGYTVNQMALSKTLRDNIIQHQYEGGHMLYLNSAARTALKSDVTDFFNRAMQRTASTGR